MKKNFNALLEDFLDVTRHANRDGFSHSEIRDVWRAAQVKCALELTGGNVTQAARLMGIHRNGLHRHIKVLRGIYD